QQRQDRRGQVQAATTAATGLACFIFRFLRRPLREHGTDAMIVVENEGEEIRPDLLPYIFDRFFRADKSRTRLDSDSVGLGLSITKAIVVAHGGKIAADCSGGKTRFTMTFPHGRLGLT
ncbi:ATP-binding protein, partial [Cupriavidus metallidurans]|uniref:ATP-binding protein n=1 Tax=Cupriavidus metallidurans TaxID=119219 RepID=UPI003CFC7D95